MKITLDLRKAEDNGGWEPEDYSKEWSFDGPEEFDWDWLQPRVLELLEDFFITETTQTVRIIGFQVVDQADVWDVLLEVSFERAYYGQETRLVNVALTETKPEKAPTTVTEPEKPPTITLTFTLDEADWLCSAMYVASNVYGKRKSKLAGWTHLMAAGLEARIEQLSAKEGQ